MRDISDLRHPLLRVPDTIAIIGIGLIAALATVIAIIESYTNLYEFAVSHGLHGWRASVAPGAIDSFIIIGEFMLFVTLVRGYDIWLSVYGWAFAGAGFIVSVAGNVGHSASAGWQTRIMSAIWPIAATAGLSASLMILKRVTADYRSKIAVTEEAGQITQASPLVPDTHPPGPSEEPRSEPPSQRAAPDEGPVGGQPKRRLRRPAVELTPEMEAEIDGGMSIVKFQAAHSGEFPTYYLARRAIENRKNGQAGPETPAEPVTPEHEILVEPGAHLEAVDDPDVTGPEVDGEDPGDAREQLLEAFHGR